MKYTFQTRFLIAQTFRNLQQNQRYRWTYSKKILKIKARIMKRTHRNKREGEYIQREEDQKLRTNLNQK